MHGSVSPRLLPTPGKNDTDGFTFSRRMPGLVRLMSWVYRLSLVSRKARWWCVLAQDVPACPAFFTSDLTAPADRGHRQSLCRWAGSRPPTHKPAPSATPAVAAHHPLAGRLGLSRTDLGGRTGQAIPGKCWVATDPFRESTVLPGPARRRHLRRHPMPAGIATESERAMPISVSSGFDGRAWLSSVSVKPHPS